MRGRGLIPYKGDTEFSPVDTVDTVCIWPFPGYSGYSPGYTHLLTYLLTYYLLTYLLTYLLL